MTREEIAKAMQESRSPVDAYGRVLGETWADGLDRLIPQHCHFGLVLWILLGIVPGSFLRAVIENDLMGACAKADETNQRALFNYANFLHNYAPGGCFGSKADVKEWAAKGGVAGK